MRSVSVVIPHWNGADLLAANLPSVIEVSRRHPVPAEVIVVDDGSTDATAAVPTTRKPARTPHRTTGESILMSNSLCILNNA